MILVMSGTGGRPFERLLRMVANAVAEEEVFVQGSVDGATPSSFHVCPTLSVAELEALLGSARAVVCHAGIGSVALALRAEIRPIVVPRLRRMHENVDDHQFLFAQRLSGRNLAVVVHWTADLRRALLDPKTPVLPVSTRITPSLVDAILPIVARSLEPTALHR